MAHELDSALFDGLVDLYPTYSFNENPAQPQADPQPIVTSPKAHPEAAALSSAQGSDASSTSENSVPASPESRACGPEPSPIDELLMLIDWKSDERHAPKRVRGDPSKSHEKHVQHEKQRRNDLAQAIDEINDLIPSTNLSSNTKRTKLATLQEAAEYFKRVQDMACMLLRENRRLAASLQEHGVQPAAVSPAPRGPILGTQEAVRLFVTTAFIVWLFVGVPTPWTPGSGATFSSVAFNSRHVLDVSTSPEAPPVFFGFFRTLMQLSIKGVVFLVAFAVAWVCTLLMDMPKISPEALRSANQLLMEGVKCVEQESNWVLAAQKHTEVMRLLRKPMPVTFVGQFLFCFVQFIRAVLNFLVVGLYLERMLVYCLARHEIVKTEAKAFMFGCRCGEGQASSGQSSSGLQYSFLRYYGCILASASCLNVVDAPLRDKDELGHRIRMFTADNPDVNSRFHMFTSSVLVSLAEGQLGRVSMDLSPQDVSEWTLFRLLESPVHQGKLEDALAVIMRLIPALKGVPQLKAVCSAAIVNFCLRRYREAFLMMSTAVKVGTTYKTMPVIAVRFLTGTVMMALFKMGHKDEARSLLPGYESMYTCVPDARANIMPNERLFLDLTKIVLADDDYAAVVTHTRDFLSLINKLGIARCFNLPYVLETTLDRLFAALQLANDAAVKSGRTTNEAFVIHQRGEISDMAEAIITLMERCAYWATYVTPMVERNKGWHAFVLRDRASASYHLNRALLEARRMELPHQEVVTKELMQKLGISLLGDSGEKLMGECPHHAAIKACVNAFFGSSCASPEAGKGEPVGAAAV